MRRLASVCNELALPLPLPLLLLLLLLLLLPVQIYEAIYKLAVIVPGTEIKLSCKSKRLPAFIKRQANPGNRSSQLGRPPPRPVHLHATVSLLSPLSSFALSFSLSHTHILFLDPPPPPRFRFRR